MEDTEFQELRDGQKEIVARLDKMNGTLRDVVVEIGGAPAQLGRDPNRRSVRLRLHRLENDKSATEAAHAALSAATQLRDAAAEKRFTRGEKIVGLAVAGVIATGPYLAPIFSHI